MPPKTRFGRERVVEAAFSIVREKGPEGLNARAIAKRLGCSTQPLYRELTGMEELRQAVLGRATGFFEAYILARSALVPQRYLSAGLAYLLFAREEPQLFLLLFMRRRTAEEQARTGADATFEYAVAHIADTLGYSPEKARAFHYHSFLYVHGLGAMIATGFMAYDQEALTGLLRQQYRALRLASETPEA